MIIRLRQETVPEAVRNSGAHQAAVPIFLAKCEIIPLLLQGVRTPAANMLKQELLACGGDAVTPAGAVLNLDRHVDVILLGLASIMAFCVGSSRRCLFLAWRRLGRN